MAKPSWLELYLFSGMVKNLVYIRNQFVKTVCVDGDVIIPSGPRVYQQIIQIFLHSHLFIKYKIARENELRIEAAASTYIHTQYLTEQNPSLNSFPGASISLIYTTLTFNI